MGGNEVKNMQIVPCAQFKNSCRGGVSTVE